MDTAKPRLRTGLNYVKTTLLLGAMTALLVLLGGRLGGQTGLVMGFSLALLMNVSSYWWSHKIVLAMHHAQEADPREVPWLFEIVDRLRQRAGIPMPRVYLIDEDAPNAFATGRNPAHAVVAVTTGLLRLLGRQELEGVLAHELGHIRNRDILIMSVAATLAGAVQMIGTMLHWGALLGFGRRESDDRGGGLEMLVWAIVAPLIAVIVQLWISRTREYAADAEGARLAGSAHGLASALRRLESANQRIPSPHRPASAHLYIVAPLSGGGMGRLFATHPPIAERIARLEALGF